MNEQLQVALATVLSKTIEGFDAGVAFMQSELPDVIEQLLMWYMVKGAMFFFLGLIIFYAVVACAIKWVKFCKADSKKYHDEFDTYILPIILGTLPLLLAIAFINLDWLQILIAPKTWLIEYAAQLAK